jgi:hypothetical protein
LREPLTTDEAAMVENDAAIEDAAPETRDPPARDPTCDPPLFPTSLPFPLFSGSSGVNVTCPKYEATQQLRHRIKTPFFNGKANLDVGKRRCRNCILVEGVAVVELAQVVGHIQ